jgi:cold shock protein
LYTADHARGYGADARLLCRVAAAKWQKFAGIVEQDRLRRSALMPTGTIKRLVRDRGFGFIRDEGGQEWFFHRSGVQGSFESLAEGQRVAFDEETSPKGPRAGNVRSES